MLYEFGKLDSSVDNFNSDFLKINDTQKPVLFFGETTSNIGAPGGVDPKKWQELRAGDNVHVVVDGCEPSTGLRFGLNKFK